MSVKPIITLLFLVTVLTILMIISILFPAKGLQISDNITFGFVKVESLFSREEDKYNKISEIIEKNALPDTSYTNPAQETQITEKDTIASEEENSGELLTRLQFPGNNAKILFPFFQSLSTASKAKKPLRILHYGDSQIEGDRISSYLRYRLQSKFGGMGVGLIPVQQLYDYGFSVRQKNSRNWNRYAIYGMRDTNAINGCFGALASFSRFKNSPLKYIDTTNPGNITSMAWVSFSPSYYSYPNTKNFQQCRVFYRNNITPFYAGLYIGDDLLNAEFYPASRSFQTIRWVFNQPVSNIKIVFSGNDSPDIYGIALDGISGIALDNIAMRGSAGLIFTRMDKKNLKDNYNELNVKMIIMQFGGNTVPYITSDYSYYEKSFYAQLKRIREILPDVAIIVIGVADMSIRKDDRFVSYPNLEKVRDALKQATFEANGVYWDLYEAMGGKNSMPGWVFAKPPLASKDFVHFNLEGSKIVAQMFYNSLIYEYNLYATSSSKSKGASDH